ncbi:RNA polymerase sigma-70 factor, ECF subfamily [Prosthecobacter debontii]|uniref:RNA polymerase sigma-70 factor, ECF subfamily n=1 Tax=Prosthecobacter debontii TaxID=48467 RepID=A0A1T4YHC0_9BACT|nr:sigma-70 family RNA polymerase sigma factor [Prosthecobacter debontii]SKB00625.1 RNA polymerase sigma-70 factor, ECF subfamily [Prosthecobacter debontii]
MDEGKSQAKPFPTTQWTLIYRVAHEDPQVREHALSEICELYWPPVYAFIRSRGYAPHDAEDLTQGFFAKILTRNDLARADMQTGKLRSYLLTAIKNHLNTEYRRDESLKRGGGKIILSLNREAAESRCLIPEPIDELNPEKVFERQWTITIMESVVTSLEALYASKNQTQLFEALKPYIITSTEQPPQAEIAHRLGMTESAIRVSIHRMRQRYAELLRQIVHSTLEQGEDVDAEISHMMASFQ